MTEYFDPRYEDIFFSKFLTSSPMVNLFDLITLKIDSISSESQLSEASGK
jgi:hypothetical protein